MRNSSAHQDEFSKCIDRNIKRKEKPFINCTHAHTRTFKFISQSLTIMGAVIPP